MHFYRYLKLSMDQKLMYAIIGYKLININFLTEIVWINKK